MKKFSLIAILIAGTALAGERLLGIISEIGPTKSNLSQAPDASQQWWDGGYEMPFFIPEMSLLTLQCNNAVFVCTDETTCTATKGVAVDPNAIFLTSANGAKGGVDQGPNPDGGPLAKGTVRHLRSAVVSILDQVSDAGFHQCKVFERNGKE
jgi:hypothetical protein